MIRRLALAALCSSVVLLAEVKLPSFTREALPNGTVVYLMPRAGVPLVEFRVLVRGGMESDPSDLAGLSNITAQLLRKGTSKRSAEKFSQDLDFLGGRFEVLDLPQAPATAISAEFLSKDFDAGLELVGDAVLHATFPDVEVRNLLAQRIDAAKAVKDNPQAAIASYFAAAFFGPSHPYGRPGDENTLARIQRSDILRFHDRQYCGKNLVVIVTGDFQPAVAAPKVRAAFASIEGGTGFTPPKSSAPAAGSRLLLVDKPEATQTYFYIGQPGIDRKSPDRVRMMLVNTIFGGSFNSMLNQALRVDSGLTYGASSVLQQPRLPGAIAITSFTRTDTTGQAVDLALDVLKRFAEKGITADQLASAKAYVKGTFPPQRFETSDQIAGVLGDMELYGLGKDDIDDLFSRIDAVSLSEANATLRKYYRSDGLTFVLLGNASKIRQSVGKYAPKITEVPITKPGIATD